LVTGASSGIGEAIARQLLQEGTEVIAVARREDRLRAITGVEPLVADLTTEAGLAAVEAQLEDVDLLVNNAGFGTTSRLVDADADRMLQEIGVDVTAVARLTRAALPFMVGRAEGGILNVSSIVGFFPTPKMATYAGAKAFVTAFTQSVAEEVRADGVKVSVLCPGLTRTEFQQISHSGQPRNLPDFTWQTPEQVAKAGLDGLAAGKVVIVPGWHNQVAATAAQMIPGGVLRKVAGLAQRARGA
jgi:short-subunit dehydrogenase